MPWWSAFLLGLAGSLHCAVMCGPLVVALAKARPSASRRLAPGAVYHSARVATYALLGLALGFAGQLVALGGFQRALSVGLGIVLIAALFAPARLPLTGLVWQGITRLKGGLGRAARQDTLAWQAGLGALNGLLPCGLVYAAAAGAAATGGALAGAAYMALFGLGTWPLMLWVSYAGERLPLPSGLRSTHVTRGAMLLLAALLILRGLELGIPYLSPPPAGAHGLPGHCH